MTDRHEASCEVHDHGPQRPRRRYIKIEPIHELLRAGEIVGLRPAEMTATALAQLAEDAQGD